MEIAEMILDSIYGICITIIGVIVLFGPYEKFKEGFPKAPSKKVVKILGAVITVLGIVMIALSVLGIM